MPKKRRQQQQIVEIQFRSGVGLLSATTRGSLPLGLPAALQELLKVQLLACRANSLPNQQKRRTATAQQRRETAPRFVRDFVTSRFFSLAGRRAKFLDIWGLSFTRNHIFDF